MPHDGNTRVDRILKGIKNNRLAAPLIVCVTGLAAIGGAWNSLPTTWKNEIARLISPRTLDNGWIFLGYLNAKDPVYWNEGPYAQVIGSDIQDPLDPFPKGRRIVLNHDREIIILDYKSLGTAKAYSAPPLEHGILSPQDHTGSILKAGTELIVRDVFIGHFPNSDYAVWTRVVQASTAD